MNSLLLCHKNSIDENSKSCILNFMSLILCPTENVPLGLALLSSYILHIMYTQRFEGANGQFGDMYIRVIVYFFQFQES